MIERILCPIDFSEFSKAAFEFALSLAERYGSKLFLLHAIEPVTLFSFDGLPGWTEMYDDFKTSAETALADLVTPEIRRRVRIESSVEVSSAAESILKLAEQKAVDLVVMGIHGVRGTDQAVIGSVTDKVVRKSKRPVLAVRTPAGGGPFRPSVQLRKVLMASDFSEEARRALSYALSLAGTYHAELVLTHVLESFADETNLRSESERLARELASEVPLEVRPAGIRTVVRAGKPYREIVQLASELKIDLIVLGGRGRSSVLDIPIFGSTTHRVLQLGPCSVLSVH